MVGIWRIGRITELSESDSVLELPEWSSRRSNFEGRIRGLRDRIVIEEVMEGGI